MKPQTTKEDLWNNPNLKYDYAHKFPRDWYVVPMLDVSRECISKSLNSARIKLYLEIKKYGVNYFDLVSKKFAEAIRKDTKVAFNYTDWLVESVMSGVFDEIILKEVKE